MKSAGVTRFRWRHSGGSYDPRDCILVTMGRSLILITRRLMSGLGEGLAGAGH